MSTARVWRATPAEAGEVARLLVSFRDWMGRSEPSAGSVAASVGRLMGDPGTEYLLGAAGGPPAGVCQLRFRYGVWCAAEDCHLEDLYVADAARGSGLGRALVQAALDRAAARGCRRVELDCNEANPRAFALYGRMGFVSGGGDGARDVLLRRRLPA